jgi:hypothetical protein
MLSRRQNLTLALIPLRMRARNLAMRAVRAYGDWTDYWLSQALIKLDPETYDQHWLFHDDGTSERVYLRDVEDLFDVFGDDDDI